MADRVIINNLTVTGYWLDFSYDHQTRVYYIFDLLLMHFSVFTGYWRCFTKPGFSHFSIFEIETWNSSYLTYNPFQTTTVIWEWTKRKHWDSVHRPYIHSLISFTCNASRLDGTGENTNEQPRPTCCIHYRHHLKLSASEITAIPLLLSHLSAKTSGNYCRK